MKTLMLTAALLLVAATALAQAASSMFSQKAPSMLDYAHRLTVSAVGAYAFDYAGHNADATTDPGKEFTAGLAARYLLTPMLTLTGGSAYHVDTKQMRSYIQVEVPFYGGKLPVSLPAPTP